MVKVCHLQSDGCWTVTRWLQEIVAQFSSAITIVEDSNDCDVLLVGDITTNNFQKNIIIIAKYISQYPSKPIVFFVHDDPDTTMGFMPNVVKNVHIFRTSLLRSQQTLYESVLPSFQCQTSNITCFEPLNVPEDDFKSPIPIGFVGADTFDDRKYLCALLQKDGRFRTQFVFRRGFHGHFKQDIRAKNEAEYKKNIQTNLFQLCCRGAGNFSHRLYEVLAYGRIPVLPDSDLVLFKHIPHSVWVNCVVMASTIECIPDAICGFYQTHDMIQVQKNARLMWETYLSFEGFAPVVESKIKELVPQITI